MFRAPAHSFSQQARLAISLSWVAGYTNALTVLICGQVTSHLSGTVSQLGVEVAELRWTEAGYLAALIAMFLLGAFTAGVSTELGRVRRFQSIYVLPMVVEAVLLAGFGLLVDRQAHGELSSARLWLTFVPAFAMGLQNATITRISGGVVRTTHVTGVVTDLGLALAELVFRGVGWSHRLDPQRTAQARWRVLLLLSIPGSFALGAGLGTVAFDFAEAWSMAPAVAFLTFLVLQDLLRPITPIALREGSHASAPFVAVFHAEPPAAGTRFRLPDLTTWAEGLGERARVVLLDLGDLPTLGERSAHELLALAVHLRQHGRSLVLAGVGRTHLAVLHDAGVLTGFDADDLCSDLQAAGRRAMQLAEG